MSQPITAEAWAKAATTEFTCSKGHTVEMRRAQLGALLVSGNVPQHLVSEVLEALSKLDGTGQEDEQAQALMSAVNKPSVDIVKELPVLVDAALIHSLVSPRVVFDKANIENNEINLKQVPDCCRLEIFSYIRAGCPDIPVALAGGGETTVEQLANFPEDGQLPGGSVAREDVPTESREAVRAGGNS